MQKAVRKYLLALEAGDAEKAGALFTKDGWVQSPFWVDCRCAIL